MNIPVKETIEKGAEITSKSLVNSNDLKLSPRYQDNLQNRNYPGSFNGNRTGSTNTTGSAENTNEPISNSD